MVNILGSFAEFERELIADRTRRGRRHKVEVRKQYLGSNTSYGYRYVPMDHVAGREGVLDIAPKKRWSCAGCFEWVDCEGFSARRVLLRLNEGKIPPKKGAASWGKSQRCCESFLHSGAARRAWRESLAVDPFEHPAHDHRFFGAISSTPSRPATWSIGTYR